jgi:5'-nucleotidase
MRILVCNDDGIKSPGLHALADAARSLAHDVWVIAPERKWSAASHQLTFGRNLTLSKKSDRVYACSGAPADCVVAAMTVLLAEGPKPDLVLSGINDKRNVAEDIAYSGTLSIAREATFWGIPAIGISRQGRWIENAGELAVLRRLLVAVWERRADWAVEGHWLSINLPASVPAPLTQALMGRDKIGSTSDILDPRPERIVYRLRRGHPGTAIPGDENTHLKAGAITVVRQRWVADAPMPDDLISDWNSAIAK